MEQIEVGDYNCKIKKQNSKTQSITFIDQPKFNKNEYFYKAKKVLNILIFHILYIKNILLFYQYF